MPALFEEDALKAQAIAARSYVLSSNTLNITSTINDQVYLTKEEMLKKWQEDYLKYYNKIKKSVDDTKGLVMKKSNKIIKSYYFAMSNGYTQDSQTVFGEKNFISVPSIWETKNINNFIVTKTFSETDLKELLNILDLELIIKDITRTKTNHVDNLKVNDIIYTGIDFRKKLNLRSTDFTIVKIENNYEITTKGYGHGVGMSQYGANEMAKIGYTYEEILKHYYNDITIENINV